MPSSTEPSEFLFDASDANFERDVVVRSDEVTVVIDFWADWCQPCKALKPVLEKLAAEYQGRFVLAKLDTDRNPQTAAEFGIQSLPTVVALRKREVVDHFIGGLRESQIRQWLDALLSAAAPATAQPAAELDPLAAAEKFCATLVGEPDQPKALLGLAWLEFSQGRIPETKQLLERLAGRGIVAGGVERLRAEVDIQEAGIAAGNVDELSAAVDGNRHDDSLRVRYAQALAAQGKFEEALDAAITVVQRTSGAPRDAAKELMLAVFNVLGADDSRTSEYRRQLSRDCINSSVLIALY